jgi:DSF synthase
MSDSFTPPVPRIRHKTREDGYSEFDPATGTLWGYMSPRGIPCLSLRLLNDIRNFDQELAANAAHIELHGVRHQVHAYVAASAVPQVFSLGGDLALFLDLIRSADRAGLAHYARLSIDNIYARTQNYSCPCLTTISLVQGQALGGGFELALSSDLIIAENSASLGFPEILLNLFPGMGAYSLLARRISPRAAEELILSGKILPAAQLHEMGVIDILAPDGQGEAVVQTWIEKNARRRNAIQGVMQARKFVHPVQRAELDAIVNTWVDSCLRLEERDLRTITRVLRAQTDRLQTLAAL